MHNPHCIFSVVSVPFALLVAKTVGVDDRFPEYYMAVVITGVITATIMPRIPPLSRFADTPYDTLHPLREKQSDGSESLLKEAVALAAKRASIAVPLKQQFRTAAGHILDIWFGLVPAVIAVEHADPFTIGRARAKGLDPFQLIGRGRVHRPVAANLLAAGVSVARVVCLFLLQLSEPFDDIVHRLSLLVAGDLFQLGLEGPAGDR